MTDLQDAFNAFQPMEISNTIQIEKTKKEPQRLPMKKYLQNIKDLHEEWAPCQLMFQNVHPDTTKQEIADILQERLNLTAIVYERGNTKYDKKERTRDFHSYGHKLIFARFEQEVTDEMVLKMRGIELLGRTIYVRRQDQNLNQLKSAFIRGIKGFMNLQNVFNKVNTQLQKFEKDNRIDDVKMIYQDKKLKGFVYIEFKNKLQRETGDRLFMKALKVDDEMVQIKKYISKKKQAKQSKNKKDNKQLGGHKSKRDSASSSKSSLTQNMMKKHNRK